MVNGERLIFLPKIRNKTTMFTLVSAIQHYTGSSMCTAVRQENDIKVIHIRKKGVKLFLLADDILLYKKIIRNSLKALE